MSQQIIDISTPDDGLGDVLRTGFDKTNQNFTELYNGKVDKVTGKGLSENDFTDADKAKLDGIEAGAQVNVNADFLETDPSAPGYILNVPPSLYSSVGFFDYNDLATQTTPLTLVSNVSKKLTNDTLGSFTNISNPPYGVATIWDETNNEFDFSSLSVGDTIDLRVDLLINTIGSNENVKMFLRLAKGSPSQYDLYFYEKTFKNSGANPIQTYYGIYIGSDDYRNYPAELHIIGDNGGTVVVNGWYTRVIRKSVNVVDFSSDPLKLDKDTTAGVERTYIINPDGSQGVKDTSDFKDVIFGYFNGTNFYTDSGFTNLITPESSKIYINIAITPSNQYRWSGSAYVQIGGSGDLKVLHKNHISGVSVVNNPNFTYKYAYGVLIPGGTIQVGDFIDIEVSFEKVSGGNAELLPRIGINTIDGTAGEVVLNYISFGSNPVYAKIQRSLVVKSSTLTEILHQGTSSVTSWGSAATSGNKNIDWSTNKYVIISIANNGASALDATWRVSSIIITKK